MLFETLETRRLMSFTWSVDGNGVLTIDGTAGNDDIHVRDRWDTAMAGDVDVLWWNTADPEATDYTTFPVPALVTGGIVLKLHGGLDVGSIDTGGPDAVLDGGDGFDVLTAHNNGAAFAVYGGEGTDQIDVYDYADVGTIAMGNGHDDSIMIQKSSGSIHSPTVAYGGNGDDFISGELPAGAELIDTDGDFVADSIVYNDADFGHARLYGGNGKDTLVSYHEDTWIDGENGKDEEIIFQEDLDRLAAMTV